MQVTYSLKAVPMAAPTRDWNGVLAYNLEFSAHNFPFFASFFSSSFSTAVKIPCGTVLSLGEGFHLIQPSPPICLNGLHKINLMIFRFLTIKHFLQYFHHYCSINSSSNSFEAHIHTFQALNSTITLEATDYSFSLLSFQCQWKMGYFIKASSNPKFKQSVCAMIN